MTIDRTDRPISAQSALCTQAAGLEDLAAQALRHLCLETKASECSGDAHTVLGNPMVAALTHALCDKDDEVSEGLFDDLLKAGLTIEEVCLGHLAPAARRLGDLWDKDRLPFTEVTMATARIQHLMRRLPSSRRLPPATGNKGAVFCAVPGEQHTLGVMMAADLFRRHGWDVGLLIGQDHNEMIARLSRDDRPVIGLSCSGDHSFDALVRLVDALKTKRPDCEIIVSGQVVEMPERLLMLSDKVHIIKDIETAEAQIARITSQRDEPALTAKPAKAMTA